MLQPNKKQRTKLFECAGTARFIYNWVLDYEQINYDCDNGFVSDYELRKKLTELKQTHEKFIWLNNYSNSKPSFYVDTDKISFTDTHVKLEKLTASRKANKQKFNHIRLAEKGRIPVNAKYSNPRVTFDGINWWISVGIEADENMDKPLNDGIGIDIGIKTLAVCSDKAEYKNINKTAKVRKLKKKKRRLQRRISKKYSKNKKGVCYRKTRNIIKSEKQLLKINHRLTNIRHDHIHKATSEIISRQPKFIVMEDLNVKGMMKNKHLAKAVQEQCFYEFYRQIQYKCQWNNIEFVTAASSKKCICCGSIKKNLKLSDRIYHCDNCGNTVDRDYQASVNLMRYYELTA